jgi:hypothetical protein
MAGIPWRGFVHDLSKFSPVEFWESVKYYHGSRSPLAICKEKEGYSKAWLHHKGRNKHHFEYWIDPMAPIQYPVIPFVYTVEMICDTFAAGIVYQGKNWTPDYQLKYFKSRKDREYINPKIVAVLEEVYGEVAEKGLKPVINKKHLREIYDRHTKN